VILNICDDVLLEIYDPLPPKTIKTIGLLMIETNENEKK